MTITLTGDELKQAIQLWIDAQFSEDMFVNWISISSDEKEITTEVLDYEP